MSTDLVIVVPSWIGLLEARARGAPWTMKLGKVERPKLHTVPFEHTEYRSRLSAPARLYLCAFGQLRARVAISALRNTVEGYWLDVDDLSGLEPVTIGRKVPLWWMGWREVLWNAWPAAEIRRGEAGHELAFPGWATEGIPAKLACEASDLARCVSPRAVAAAPPAPAPERRPPPPPPGTRPAKSEKSAEKAPPAYPPAQIGLVGVL